MCLTQAQIVEFCRTEKDKLSQDWYTFFLFKVGGEFFVAFVYFVVGGQLRVGSYRFSRDGVWNAEYRHRIVVPQLTLKPLDISPSDSLTLRVSELERKLAEIGKIIHP